MNGILRICFDGVRVSFVVRVLEQSILAMRLVPFQLLQRPNLVVVEADRICSEV